MEDKTNQDHVTNPFYISCICKIRPDELTCHIGGNTINNLHILSAFKGRFYSPDEKPYYYFELIAESVKHYLEYTRTKDGVEIQRKMKNISVAILVASLIFVILKLSARH